MLMLSSSKDCKDRYDLTNEINNFAIGHSDVMLLESPISDSRVAV